MTLNKTGLYLPYNDMYKPRNAKFHQTVVRQRQMNIIKSILVEYFEL